MEVVILDTGCANLASVSYAVKRLGYNPQISRDPDIVLRSDKLFLPGVGSAPAAMKLLKERKLIALIRACTQPVLGICLGMQLMAKNSEEGNIKTLGIIDAQIKQIPDHNLPLPHIGWNKVNSLAGHHLFRGIEGGAYFYFVHGFAMPVCSATIAHSTYGEPFTAAVQQDNFFGVQFHPERSGQAGAQLLKNFLEI